MDGDISNNNISFNQDRSSQVDSASSSQEASQSNGEHLGQIYQGIGGRV